MGFTLLGKKTEPMKGDMGSVRTYKGVSYSTVSFSRKGTPVLLSYKGKTCIQGKGLDEGFWIVHIIANIFDLEAKVTKRGEDSILFELY